MTKEEQIEEILRKFDFEKVAIVMRDIDWCWATTNWVSPSAAQLEDSARERLGEVASKGDSRYYYEESGGLRAENAYGKLGLFFILEGRQMLDRGDGTLTVF